MPQNPKDCPGPLLPKLGFRLWDSCLASEKKGTQTSGSGDPKKRSSFGRGPGQHIISDLQIKSVRTERKFPQTQVVRICYRFWDLMADLLDKNGLQCLRAGMQPRATQVATPCCGHFPCHLPVRAVPNAHQIMFHMFSAKDLCQQRTFLSKDVVHI